jgi:hypothetical protein
MIRLNTEAAPYMTQRCVYKRCPPRGSTITEYLLSLRSPGHVCIRNRIARRGAPERRRLPEEGVTIKGPPEDEKKR